MAGIFTGQGNFSSNDREMEQNGLGLSSQRSSHFSDPAPIHKIEDAIGTEISTLVGKGSSKGSSEDEARPENDEATRETHVTKLARQLTEHSMKSTDRQWCKHALSLKEQAGLPNRTAGISFKNLSVHGYGAASDYQKTVANTPLQAAGIFRSLMGNKGQEIKILRDFEGVVRPGEMLVVLGPPGSGCSTFLKAVAGETNGLYLSKDAHINYQGITAKQMTSHFRGEAVYTAEVDAHFPQLSVGDTLYFAARARAPRHAPAGLTQRKWAEHRRDVVMSVMGISHTINTRVGNDFVRGVSGGERKRVTLSEVVLSEAPLQCWDNSTRGLDSANAIEFCKTLRLSADIMGSTALLSLYQSPQAAYDQFDKVCVIYEGRQIYFGKTTEARQYFIDLGFECPDRQTVPDFCTSMCSPDERIIRPGFEATAPKSPDEFAAAWKASQARVQLLEEIEAFEAEFPVGGDSLKKFQASRRAQQAKDQRAGSPYTLSYKGQVELCLWRAFRRLVGDPSLSIFQLIGNSLMSLVISSVFYDLPADTSSFYSRGALLFFSILLAAFSSALEILILYAQRPIVEKQQRYALYHPSAEAFAHMASDIPYKFFNAIFSNLILYFMSHLRREPGPFFFFLLISFTTVLCMSMFFRTIASASRTLAQALAPAAVVILGLVVFSGFAISTTNMLGWSRWINYIDPVAYGFEALMINEFHGREFPCVGYIPSGAGYANVDPASRICSVVGAVAGASSVQGERYINLSFEYYHNHKWRNFGIIIAFGVFFLCTYLFFAETVSAKKSKGEILVFRRGHAPPVVQQQLKASDPESGEKTVLSKRITSEKEKDALIANVVKQESVFSWSNMCYDVKIKKETRRILDHVDGWVQPGKLTALMGVSGAGKTTLLDVLATRVTMGVVTGEALVDGHPRDASFQRKTGYVQQQDLHLETSTVREALEFSALLRQPAKYTKQEKLDYVDEVIKLLDMEDYADAVVGVPGEGLNVEQRKRLTIGVELAAKPALLLFLDEPTSGLDSQTSWSILDLMEKLAKAGQSILCTIHQPSAMLFQRFDRLLFLARGGRTVYFGEIGPNASYLTDYFARNGAHPCGADENPAEYMLAAIGAAPGSHSDIDWPATWRASPEYQGVQQELQRLKAEGANRKTEGDKSDYAEFAAPFSFQMWLTFKRVALQYWRTPSYIYSKFLLIFGCGIFIGFIFFKSDTSEIGLQNQMFSIFMLFTIFLTLVQQTTPLFVTQRALYEVRERPSKTYSWIAFVLSNIFIELPYQTFCSVGLWAAWYFPIGYYKNAEYTGSEIERGGLMFLFIWQFLLMASTFSHMMIAGIDTAENAGNFGQLLFSFCLIFNGVLASPEQMPGFWIFMYRVSPFTYLFEGMVTTAVANAPVVCKSFEYLSFAAPAGQTCGEYLSSYISASGGYLKDASATDTCNFCTMDNTNQFLATVSATYSHRWRDFGIVWVYVVFNAVAALFFYWLARVPKKARKEKTA